MPLEYLQSLHDKFEKYAKVRIFFPFRKKSSLNVFPWEKQETYKLVDADNVPQLIVIDAEQSEDVVYEDVKQHLAQIARRLAIESPSWNEVE